MDMRSLSRDLAPRNYLNKCLLRSARTGQMPGNPRAHLDVPDRGALEVRRIPHPLQGAPALLPLSRALC